MTITVIAYRKNYLEVSLGSVYDDVDSELHVRSFENVSSDMMLFLKELMTRDLQLRRDHPQLPKMEFKFLRDGCESHDQILKRAVTAATELATESL